MRQKFDSVKALPSATVVLLRKGKSDPEVLMVKRRAGDAFGDSYTFPGGVVDDDESEARDFCAGTAAEKADAELGLPSGGLDFYSAAVRELFEETGVLLACDSHGNWAFSSKPDHKSLLRRLRGGLDSGVLHWVEILRTQNIYIACDALHYFSFWETPLSLPKRWATRFFIAELPPHQDAQHDNNELTDSCWITALDVLSICRQGGMKLPFATQMTLKKISKFRTIDEILCWAKKQVTEGVARLRPAIVMDNGKTRFVFPGDADFPEDGY